MAYRVVAAPVPVLAAQLSAPGRLLRVIALKPAESVLDDNLIVAFPVALVFAICGNRNSGEQQCSEHERAHCVRTAGADGRYHVGEKKAINSAWRGRESESKTNRSDSEHAGARGCYTIINELGARK